jgi:ComF family protein
LLRRLRPPQCSRCGAPTVWPVDRCRECAGRRFAFARAQAAVVYTGPARALVSAWKEHGLRRAASLAAELVTENVAQPPADVIAYIPPHADRLLRRGHHPAESLSRELGRRWQLDVETLLRRTLLAGANRQARLARAERARNVRGMFEAVAPVSASRVLLVDDVYTTGATVAAAAHALRTAGAERVDVVAFARTVLD